MKYLSGLIVLMFLVSCSTVSPTCDVPQVTGNEASTIIIYRPSAMIGGVYSSPMSIDRCSISNLGNDSFIIYKLPPGLHRIAVEKRNLEFGSGASIEMQFESGKTYYFRQSVSLVASLTLVDKETALSEMPRLKQ